MTKYKIRVDDIYHQGFEDDACYIKEEFFSYEEAITYCKNFLDQDLKNILLDCKNEKDFYAYWSFHGEVLYIFPSNKEYNFDSRDYVTKQVSKHFNN